MAVELGPIRDLCRPMMHTDGRDHHPFVAESPPVAYDLGVDVSRAVEVDVVPRHHTPLDPRVVPVENDLVPVLEGEHLRNTHLSREIGVRS